MDRSRTLPNCVPPAKDFSLLPSSPGSQTLPRGFCQEARPLVPVGHAHRVLSTPCLRSRYNIRIRLGMWHDRCLPRALPRAYINPVSHVDPVVIPAGKAVTCKAYRTLRELANVLDPWASLTQEDRPEDRALESQSRKSQQCCQHMDPSPIPFQSPW